MRFPVNEEDFKERNVVDPSGIVQVIKNYWWWCVDGDPARALFYAPRRSEIGSPQCNQSEAIARRVGESLGHDKRAQMVQIPLALSPWEG
jgi:hypothetical protein